MPNVIKLKRSATTATPTALSQGEIAYSESTGGSGNLFIGVAGAGVEKIGGQTDVVKLSGIEVAATADQTDAEIRTAVEAATDSNVFTDADHNKLDAIEALADVTDATNVAGAGAVMESDATTALMGFVVDEDTMASNLATKVPTQQSVKAYVDTEVTGALTSEMSFKGDYDASTNTPLLDATPITIAKGDTYVVTVAGTFFTIAVEVGDTIMAKIASATLVTDWVIVNRNLDNASIKVAYEANADTNAFTDANVTTLGNQSGTNTGNELAATETVVGIVELATQVEVDAGTDTTRVITPATLASALIDGGTF